MLRCYRLVENGAVINWFDIDMPEGYLSLNDKMGTVLQTAEGQQLITSMMGGMMDVKMTKEQLLGINAQLDRIPKPQK